MGIRVNVDNFRRAETARMFHDLQADAGGVNQFRHNRKPASIDHQTVIRLNRDTLYSMAIVDVAEGATVTLPDAGDRYLSVMVVDADHYVTHVFHDAGDHAIPAGDADHRHVLLAARILVDPTDPDDVAAVGRLQDQLAVAAPSSDPYAPPDYDTESLDRTRKALLALAAGLTSFDHTFGTREQVDPVRHLIGTAAGWGGLPTTEASYVGVSPGDPDASLRLTLRDVPVDAFWSISVYDAQGYFAPNPSQRYTVNSVTGARDADGSVTVHFLAAPDVDRDVANGIPIPGPGWNFVVRLYRPRPEVLDGTWTVPALEPLA